MIGRRGFIGSLLAAFAAPKVPVKPESLIGESIPINPPGLMFHRDAFLLAYDRIPIEVNVISSQDFTFTEDELKLSIDDFGERYLASVAERAHQAMLEDHREQMKFLSGDRR